MTDYRKAYRETSFACQTKEVSLLASEDASGLS